MKVAALRVSQQAKGPQEYDPSTARRPRECSQIPDEDAEFAAEIRAAFLLEERRGSRDEGSCLPLQRNVVYEGFGHGGGGLRGNDLTSPPEIGGPVWLQQGGQLLKRRRMSEQELEKFVNTEENGALEQGCLLGTGD